jgi:hypothetical protein
MGRANGPISGRGEAVLTLIAKMEASLRDERRRALRSSDDARRRGEHGNRAYWSGLAEGYRHAADVALQNYEQVRHLYRSS